MKYLVYSHCDGNHKFPLLFRKDIEEAISGINIHLKIGAAKQIRDGIINSLCIAGWSGGLALTATSNIAITSSKNGVGLCLQTGNYARTYADLLKLQTLYLNGTITTGALVLPSLPVSKKLGSNIANATRLERELDIFKKVYSLPTLVFSLEE